MELKKLCFALEVPFFISDLVIICVNYCSWRMLALGEANSLAGSEEAGYLPAECTVWARGESIMSILSALLDYSIFIDS